MSRGAPCYNAVSVGQLGLLGCSGPVGRKASHPKGVTAIPAESTARTVAESPGLTLSVPEAAAWLGVRPRLVWGQVNRGELPSVRLGRRVLVPRDALIATLSRRTRGGAGAGS